MADPLINDTVLDRLVDMVIEKGRKEYASAGELPMKDVSIVLDDKTHKLFPEASVTRIHLKTLFRGRSMNVIRNALANAKTYKSLIMFDPSAIVIFLDKVIGETRSVYLFEEIASMNKLIGDLTRKLDILIDHLAQDPSERKMSFKQRLQQSQDDKTS